MNISEILELTKTKPIAEVAKEHLAIGEKPARLALKQAGCYTIVGQSGWFLDESENPDNLDKSIYYFADQVKQQKEGILKAAANLSLNYGTVDMIPRKRHSFDLDVRLVKELKLHCVKEDKTLYEVVEAAIREYMDRADGKE